MTRRFLWLCVVIATALALVACSGSDGASDGGSSGELKLGESAQVGAWTFVATEVRDVGELSKEPMGEGNKFIAVKVTRENTGEETLQWQMDEFLMVRDSDGNEYEPNGFILPNDLDLELSSGAMPPHDEGENDTGEVPFEVSAGATGLVLVFTPDTLGSGETPPEWSLPDAAGIE